MLKSTESVSDTFILFLYLESGDDLGDNVLLAGH